MRSHLNIYRLLTWVIAVGYISSQSISSQSWSNLIQDLSLKVHNEKQIESHPLNEGFMLMSENHPKPSKKPDNRIFKSNNTLSTTCRTVVIVKTKKQTTTAPPIVDHSIGHLGRRLLNEPNHNVDNEEFASFMKVDEEELSKQLLNMESTMDGSGPTTEPPTQESTTTTTTTALTPTEEIILPNNTKITLVMNCSNSRNITQDILNRLNATFSPNISLNSTEHQCDNQTGKVNVSLEIITDNSAETINQIYEEIENAIANNGVEVYADSPCGNGGQVQVTDVTSCFIVNRCYMCGGNPLRGDDPPRGVCVDEYNEVKCECLPNRIDPTRPYSGQFCYTSKPPAPLSNPADWTPVIIGSIAGVIGLIALISAFLWVMIVWGPLSPPANSTVAVRRLWHLPRAQVPTPVTSGNVPDNLDNTFSTLSSDGTNPDSIPSDITDSTFFKDLDQKMGENLRATITRPNTGPMLAGLPSGAGSPSSAYDPIDELDAIIDNEDLNPFHDPLDDLFDDDGPLEAVNPNLQMR